MDATDARTTAARGAEQGPSGAPQGVAAPGPWDDPTFGVRLLGAVPAAAFVIDGLGTIRYATASAAALVGSRPEAMVGTSVLDFVDAQTAWAYAAAVAMATDYPSVTMGPLRVTFSSAAGERTGDLWALNRLDDPEIEGIVCLLTEETAAMGLGDAISALANNESLTEVTQRVASAMRGQPVAATAAVALRDGEGFRIVRAGGSGAGALPDVLFADDELWREVVETGQRTLVSDVAELPPAARSTIAAAGFRAVWVEPVPGGEELPVGAALILWRTRPGNPSPNQLNSIHQAAGILSVALRLAPTAAEA